MGQYGQEESRRSRLRVRKACEVCKKRKVKCDGEQPCVNCVKHAQECRYVSGGNGNGSGSGRKRYKTAASVGGAGSGVTSAAAITAADAAFGASPAVNSGLCRTSNTTPLKRRSPWQSFSLDKYRFHRRYQNLLPFYLGASLMAEIPPSAIESHHLKQPRIQNYGWNMSGGHYLRHDSSSKARARAAARVHGVASLDPENFFDYENPVHLSVVNKLLQFFFQEINPPFSIVHEPMFWQQFNKRFLPHTKVRDSSAKLFQSILFLILAITLRFRDGILQSDDDDGGGDHLFLWEELEFLRSNQREEPLFKYAYSVVTELTFEWESFELIQSWLLITFYFRTCYRQTACWNALGQAINLCNGMSLYLNRFPRAHLKYDESRAWHCYWSCFIMDKLVSFQMGRYYQLAPPVAHMSVPGHWCRNRTEPWKSSASDGSDAESASTDNDDDNDKDDDDWFHDTTTRLFQLAVIVQTCQKRDGEELDLEESLTLRRKLDQWFHCHVVMTKIEDKWQHLYEIQPLLSYLDVRLTFETRRLFLLINQPLDTGEMIFPVDTLGLVRHCQLSIKILMQIDQRKLFFIPWWLNLSQLFTVSVICITLIHSGLQVTLSKTMLSQCMDVWEHLVSANPKCPPGMLPECLWCIKMLNHMCCLRLMSSAAHLEKIVGTNPGDSTPNENKFAQFGKVGESGRINSDDEAMPITLKQNAETAISRAVDATDELAEPAELPLKVSNFSEQLANTPATTSQAQEFSRVYNIPPSSIAGTGSDVALNVNSDPNEALDEGLFSYLQWFDQNFI